MQIISSLEKKQKSNSSSGLNLDGQRVGQFPGMGEVEGKQMGYKVRKS